MKEKQRLDFKFGRPVGILRVFCTLLRVQRSSMTTEPVDFSAGPALLNKLLRTFLHIFAMMQSANFVLVFTRPKKCVQFVRALKGFSFKVRNLKFFYQTTIARVLRHRMHHFKNSIFLNNITAAQNRRSKALSLLPTDITQALRTVKIAQWLKKCFCGFLQYL